MLSVKGDIESSSFICFEEDFTGDFTGNVTLEDEQFYICTEKGKFDINTLAVSGEDAFLQVETAKAPAGEIRIGKLVSTVDFPVRANVAQPVSIASGGTPHVHDFTSGEVEATCLTPARTEYVCNECGQVNFDIEEEEIPGRCPVELLVHVDEVKATETTGGVAEHWECPLCGRCYATPDGSQPFSGPVTSLPLNFLCDPDVLYSLDDIFSWKNEFPEMEQVKATGAAGIILSIIDLAATFGMSLPSLIKDDSVKWDQVNAKLDAIKESLDRIEQKINKLPDHIEAASYRQVLMERNLKFNFIRTKTLSLFEVINDCLKDSRMDRRMKLFRNF